MPSWWQNLKSTLASYYREYEFVTAIYVLEPWERRWANGKLFLIHYEQITFFNYHFYITQFQYNFYTF